MKKPYYLLLLLAVALFSGCSKDDDNTEDPVDKLFSFNIKNEKSFTAAQSDINTYYAAQQFGLNYPLPVSGVASDTEKDFRDNNTSTSLVTAIRAREVYLTMPDNETENFGFLEKMDIYIASDTTGYDAVLMAYNRNISATVGKKLVFTPTDNSMDKYVKAGKYALILKDVKLRRTVATNLKITARLTYTVTANPLK